MSTGFTAVSAPLLASLPSEVMMLTNGPAPRFAARPCRFLVTYACSSRWCFGISVLINHDLLSTHLVFEGLPDEPHDVVEVGIFVERDLGMATPQVSSVGNVGC